MTEHESRTLRVISWNVNGLRSILKAEATRDVLGSESSFVETPTHSMLSALFARWQADIFCLQESKISLRQIPENVMHVPGYESFWSCSRDKKGYSGVATFVREGLTLKAWEGVDEELFDREGRILFTDHHSFVLCNVYVPNGCSGEERLQYKMQCLDALRKRCAQFLTSGKPVIVCGDLNICHQDIDYHTPHKIPSDTSSFLPVERAWIDQMISEHRFVDAFRSRHPESTRAFTWWDPKTSAREANIGWRLDYFLVSQDLFTKHTKECSILTDQHGSDHCPILLELKDIPSFPPPTRPPPHSSKLRRKQMSMRSFFAVRKPDPPSHSSTDQLPSPSPSSATTTTTTTTTTAATAAGRPQPVSRSLSRAGMRRLSLRAPAHASLFDRSSSSIGLDQLRELDSATHRNWSAELYSLLAVDAEGDHGTAVVKLEALADLADDFVATAQHYGKIIIAETFLPAQQKTVRPVNVGGIAGGEKYIIQGVLFKFAFDACVGKRPAPPPSNDTRGDSDRNRDRDRDREEVEVWMYGGDQPDHELAMKAAGAELLCLVQFLSAVRDTDPVKLTVPLVCLIDYLGFRLYASSLLPISSNTLAFGSADGGRVFHNAHAALAESVNAACARLNLKSHLAGVGSDDVLRTNGPGDLEAHWHEPTGSGYVIDFARLFPPEVPSAAQRAHYPRSVFFRFLRPEFVQSYRLPLCSDAYTGWVVGDPEANVHNAELRQATVHLYQETIPSFAAFLSETYGTLDRERGAPPPAKLAETDLKLLFHERGINLRHLGVVHQLVKCPTIQKALLNEMIARVLKQDLRARVRSMMKHVKVPCSTPYHRLVVDSLNIILQHSKRAHEFWTSECAEELERRFQCVLSPNPKETDANLPHNLLKRVDRAVLLTRFTTMTGIKVSNRLLQSISRLEEWARVERIHPDDLEQFGYASPYTQAQMTDIQQFGVVVKHMMLMQRSSSAALYLRSTSIEPTSTSAIEQITSLLLAAQEKLQHARLSNPLDPAVLHTNALVHLELARMTQDQAQRALYLVEAERDFRRTLQAQPEDSSAHFRLGVVLAEKGNWSEAQEACLRAVQVNRSFLGTLLDVAEQSFNAATTSDWLSGQQVRFAHFHLTLAKLALDRFSQEQGVGDEASVASEKAQTLTARRVVILRCLSILLLHSLRKSHDLLRLILTLLDLPVSGQIDKTLYKATTEIVEECLRLSPNCFEPTFTALEKKQNTFLTELAGTHVPVLTVRPSAWINVAQYSTIVQGRLESALKHLVHVNGDLFVDMDRNDVEVMSFFASLLGSVVELDLSKYATVRDEFLDALSSPALTHVVLPDSRQVTETNFISFLDRHPTITHLSLGNMPLLRAESYAKISQLKNLTSLSLTNSSVTDQDLVTILRANGTTLRRLSVTSCMAVSDESSVRALAEHASALQELHLEYFYYSDLSPLATWRDCSLESVTLVGGRSLKEPCELFSVLSALSTLREVNVRGHAPVFKSESALQPLAALPSVRRMAFPGAPLSAQHLQLLSGVHLTTLDLSSNSSYMNDESFVALTAERLPALSCIDLTGCRRIDQISIAHLVREWPNLEELSLFANTSEGVMTLSALSHLKSLTVEATSGALDTNATTTLLRGCKELRSLYLIRGTFQDAAMAELPRTLRSLRVANCGEFTGRTLASRIREFTELEELRFDTLVYLRDSCLCGIVIGCRSLKKLIAWSCTMLSMVTMRKLAMARPAVELTHHWTTVREYEPLRLHLPGLPVGFDP